MQFEFKAIVLKSHMTSQTCGLPNCTEMCNNVCLLAAIQSYLFVFYIFVCIHVGHYKLYYVSGYLLLPVETLK